jgi:alkanesulfonate monooxygenase SsuD/methylene tetrahydromethanopterin reductase-like flavin-dependent oxidoreductase (luciferase family)
VVESFATLDAFHPGRIDLGVGRSGQRPVRGAAGETAGAQAGAGLARGRRASWCPHPSTYPP